MLVISAVFRNYLKVRAVYLIAPEPPCGNSKTPLQDSLQKLRKPHYKFPEKMHRYHTTRHGSRQGQRLGQEALDGAPRHSERGSSLRMVTRSPPVTSGRWGVGVCLLDPGSKTPRDLEQDILEWSSGLLQLALAPLQLKWWRLTRLTEFFRHWWIKARLFLTRRQNPKIFSVLNYYLDSVFTCCSW